MVAVAIAKTLEVGAKSSFGGEKFPFPDIPDGFDGSADHEDGTELLDMGGSDLSGLAEDLNEIDLPVGSVSDLTRGLSANGAEPGMGKREEATLFAMMEATAAFSPGDAVEIHGLANAKQHNGKEGVIEEYVHEKER